MTDKPIIVIGAGMCGISTAIWLQRSGHAVTLIDEATQQNAALVEQMAAAASGLKEQAKELVGVVTVFRLAT